MLQFLVVLIPLPSVFNKASTVSLIEPENLLFNLAVSLIKISVDKKSNLVVRLPESVPTSLTPFNNNLCVSESITNG